MDPAPIALFVYNRPAHTRLTVEALMKNELAANSDLYIFADGSRQEKDHEGMSKVRDYIKKVRGFRSIHIQERQSNLGLAASVIAGVTELADRCGRAIVLEDDLVTSPFFLRFMNDALDLYASEERVISIHGYVYPVRRPLPETFFIKGADCWGWATWKRGWELFEADGQKLLNELKSRKLTRGFDFNNRFPYTKMLEDQIAGRNDSWAIRWYASAFLKDRLTLYPGLSLIQNIGIDGSGTHGISSEDFSVTTAPAPLAVKPLMIAENAAARKTFEQYFREMNPGNIRRFLMKLQGYYPRLVSKGING